MTERKPPQEQTLEEWLEELEYYEKLEEEQPTNKPAKAEERIEQKSG
jgi:hypothetical protein